MGKKIPAEMAAQKERFTAGCLEHGMKPIATKNLWEQIETFAAYGFNKCLTADTPIRRKNVHGEVEDVPLLSIQTGDMVGSLDEKAGRIEWQKVEHKTAMGGKPLLRITTENHSIRATHNHPFLVKDPNVPLAYTSAIFSAGWVDASNLNVGDYIAAIKKAPTEVGVPLLIDESYRESGWRSSDDLIWVPVSSIEPAGEEDVWDIGVQGTHSFIADGLIVHNSHAASYGNLAYKTAYMKANFPVDYMAAVLTADAGDVEKQAETVAECTRIGIKVWPPSVNDSNGTFTVIQSEQCIPSGIEGGRGLENPAGDIRFGLYSIKNFGTGVGDSIVAARNKGGKPARPDDTGRSGRFTDIADFLSRIPDRNLNKKSLEALIMSGALDELGERGQLLANVETFLNYHREHIKAPSNQSSLFSSTMLGTSGRAPLRLSAAPAATMDQKLSWEKELLGLYVSGHPLDKHKDKLKNQKTTIKHAKENLKGAETVIAGFVETVRPLLTKKGEKMAFLKLADFSGDIEVVAFPRILKEHEKILIPGSCVMLKGRVSDRNGTPSFVAEKVKAL